MAAPVWSQDDIASALQQHLPTGRAWPRYPQVVQSQVLSALALTFQRLTARGANLLIDGFPSTTVELLPEWQKSLGLPDPCAGDAPTLAQEQAQVLARFEAGGGQSAAYFAAFAATLGFGDITITQFVPFRAGINAAGQPAYGLAWAFAWQINGDPVQLSYFTVGNSTVGQPLGQASGTDVLVCEMDRLSPAHTALIFSF